MAKLLKLLGYFVSLLMVGCGILLISGYLVPNFAGGNRVRVAFGIVVLLYGVLRFVQTRMKSDSARDG